VAVRVVEIDAPAAIEMIDLARPLTPEIRVVLDTAGADAGESSVEFGIADQEVRDIRSIRWRWPRPL
jgi:hypothetical protein